MSEDSANRICSVPDCPNELFAKKLCRTHYARKRKGKSLSEPIRKYGGRAGKRVYANMPTIPFVIRVREDCGEAISEIATQLNISEVDAKRMIVEEGIRALRLLKQEAQA